MNLLALYAPDFCFVIGKVRQLFISWRVGEALVKSKIRENIAHTIVNIVEGKKSYSENYSNRETSIASSSGNQVG